MSKEQFFGEKLADYECFEDCESAKHEAIRGIITPKAKSSKTFVLKSHGGNLWKIIQYGTQT